MARYFYSGARDTVQQAKKIDLSWLRKNNFLIGLVKRNIKWSINGEPTGNIDITIDISSETPKITFSYKLRKHGEVEWNDINFSFNLESIPCRFGGKKWFYVCELYSNGKYCGKRSRVLYMTGDYFGCRKCANLSYESCNENKRFRGGIWKVFLNETKADEYYQENVKRHFYKGKATKKYQKYLKMTNNYSDKEIYELEMMLLNKK